eukprot:9504168-Pyramimonas_sp.AAC.1
MAAARGARRGSAGSHGACEPRPAGPGEAMAQFGGQMQTLPLPPTISEGEGGVHFIRELPNDVNPALPLRNRGGSGWGSHVAP